MKDLELFTWWCQNLMKYILNNFKIINWDCGFESLQQTKKTQEVSNTLPMDQCKPSFPLQQQKISVTTTTTEN